MLNISENEKKVLFFWGIIGIIVVLVLVMFVYEKEETIKSYEQNMVSNGTKEIIDKSRYYTIKSAINKFYSYINSKDNKSILEILDKDYINKNHIDEDTVSNYIHYNDKQLSYNTGIMCYKSYKNGVYTFVTEGNEVGMLSNETFDKKYYEISMNGEKLTFSLKPIEEKEYTEVCNG